MTSINGRVQQYGSESSREQTSRERIGQGPIGTFTPRSELACEQKGCDSSTANSPSVLDSCCTISMPVCDDLRYVNSTGN